MLISQDKPHHSDPILSSSPPQYTIGLGSRISKPEAKIFFSSSISNIDGCLCMIALIVSSGDELEAYESRLLDIMELFDEEERRREVRMLEKLRDWKREVRIFAVDDSEIVT